MRAEPTHRNAHVKKGLGRHKNLSSPEELPATRPQMTWSCDRLALANDRWSLAGTTTWCVDGTCMTSPTKDIPQTHTWKIEGEVTLLRDDVAKARTEELAWYEKFEACEGVRSETCLSRTGRKPISCRWRDTNNGNSEREGSAKSMGRA